MGKNKYKYVYCPDCQKVIKPLYGFKFAIFEYLENHDFVSSYDLTTNYDITSVHALKALRELYDEGILKRTRPSISFKVHNGKMFYYYYSSWDKNILLPEINKAYKKYVFVDRLNNFDD